MRYDRGLWASLQAVWARRNVLRVVLAGAVCAEVADAAHDGGRRGRCGGGSGRRKTEIWSTARLMGSRGMIGICRVGKGGGAQRGRRRTMWGRRHDASESDRGGNGRPSVIGASVSCLTAIVSLRVGWATWAAFVLPVRSIKSTRDATPPPPPWPPSPPPICAFPPCPPPFVHYYFLPPPPFLQQLALTNTTITSTPLPVPSLHNGTTARNTPRTPSSAGATLTAPPTPRSARQVRHSSTRLLPGIALTGLLGSHPNRMECRLPAGQQCPEGPAPSMA